MVKKMMRAFVALIAAIATIGADEKPSTTPFVIHKFSPFKQLHHDILRLSNDWSMNGSNWRRHVWNEYDGISVTPETSTTITTTTAIEPPAPKKDDNDLPPAGKVTFSTCSDNVLISNALQSPLIDALPGHRPPFVISAEFGIYVSETCLRAHRHNCRSGIDLYLHEAVTLFNRTHFDRQIIYNGSTTTSPIDHYNNRIMVIPKTSFLLSVVFRVNRLPFRIEFRDARGACLEIRGARVQVSSCLIAQPATNRALLYKLRSATTQGDTGEQAANELALPENNSSLEATTRLPIITEPIKPKMKTELLADLNCLCSAGFKMSEDDSQCLPCPPETFNEAPHHSKSCISCPLSSTAPFPESISCTCLDDTFRAPGDNLRQPCTSPPSAPSSVKIWYLDTHSASVNWTAPHFLGNRTDLTYQVECVAGCRDVTLTRDWNAFGSDESVVVTLDDIWTVTKRVITIRIYSHNGVSGVAGPGYSRHIEAVLRLPRSINETGEDRGEPTPMPEEENFFASIFEAVGILGLIGIAIGTLTLCCLIFCLVRYLQDNDESNNRREVKILGMQTPASNVSSRRGSLQESSEESSRLNSSDRAADFIMKMPLYPGVTGYSGEQQTSSLSRPLSSMMILPPNQLMHFPVSPVSMPVSPQLAVMHSPLVMPLLEEQSSLMADDFPSTVDSETATVDSGNSIYATPPSSVCRFPQNQRASSSQRFGSLPAGYYTYLPPLTEQM